MPSTDRIKRDTAQPMPTYKMDDFLNSAEGWNLFIKLRSTRHPIYQEAKSRYDIERVWVRITYAGWNV